MLDSLPDTELIQYSLPDPFRVISDDMLRNVETNLGRNCGNLHLWL